MESLAVGGRDQKSPAQRASCPLRFVTATSLFDGHDASINIMRRVLLSEGAEVIHLGHDRGAAEIVRAAIEEDAAAIAVSSYQGGHVEFFSWMTELLREAGREDILVFGGGGGTITDREIALLESRGVEKIYSVEDGRQLGLVGMIQDMMARAGARFERRLAERGAPDFASIRAEDTREVAQAISYLEELGERALTDASAAQELDAARAQLRAAAEARAQLAPVLGITGTGGAGKSSLTDGLVRRFTLAWEDRRVAILSVDPSRRRTGGALLGDRIRMNAIHAPTTYMRSMATRQANSSVSSAVVDSLALLKLAGFDLVILETAGIGQSSSEVVDLATLSMYVMTPEYGAPTQLEKIDMIDWADLIAINKSDKRGAEDALRYVRKQYQRNHQRFTESVDAMPVFACRASSFSDQGMDDLFAHLNARLNDVDGGRWALEALELKAASNSVQIPTGRIHYLADIAQSVRGYKARAEDDARLAWRVDGVGRALEEFDIAVPAGCAPFDDGALAAADATARPLMDRYNQLLGELGEESRNTLAKIPQLLKRYTDDQNAYTVRGREIRVENYRTTLSGTRVPKVAVPKTRDLSGLLRWSRLENVPGEFPYTAGVFPYKREGEDPTRMFAGEGMPERTNRRFHLLAQAQPAARLSTAFDSVTLYGRDPQRRPDVFGKIGNSGVSVATLDDAKRLYSGFDLCAPTTSVSMTINGPAPVVLALFLNTAIDQAAERFLRESGQWESAQAKIAAARRDYQPTYRAEALPPTHDGSGLGLLGVHADEILAPQDYARIQGEVLRAVRGTVQADILKEDQAQNTCIFSTDFAMKMMGDIQEYFCRNDIANFYSVSISGYHIAEAGANPITQLAFTLANGFTLVEYYLARGMSVDAFARNLSFFFSNGIDAEYSVIGRVARRIWAVALRDRYGASARSQQLKYHIQTSGRSLHAQEIDFNDIRTTLQALYAISDNCNSLHTNAYDEAITTPTEESVRRALAIQLILNREFGLLFNENPLQGAYIIEELTDLVEEAVLEEFIRLSERGGVLGAMELMYQRGKIQDESLDYEHKKHSGEIPIIGVNTFLAPNPPEGVVEIDMARSSDEEKLEQIEGVEAFQAAKADRCGAALERLQRVALEGGNLFQELMYTTRYASAGQITEALFAVGGQYRRNV